MRFALAASLGLLVATPVLAQQLPPLKSGAWEITSTGGGAKVDLSAHMAKMPPQVQEMMKKNMEKSAMTSHGIKHCARPGDEDFSKSMMSEMGMNIQCTHSPITQSGSTYKWQSKCTGTMPTGAPMNSETAHTMVLKGDTAFEHTYTSKSQVQGMAAGAGDGAGGTTGRYLGQDCKAHGALTMAERKAELDAMRANRDERRRERIQMRTGKE